MEPLESPWFLDTSSGNLFIKRCRLYSGFCHSMFGEAGAEQELSDDLVLEGVRAADNLCES